MKQWCRKHIPAAVTLALYAGALALYLLWHLLGFVQYRVGVANGSLAPVALTVADFDCQDIEVRGENELFCTGTDPQMILKDSAQQAAGVVLDIEYSLPPELVNVFWADAGQAYSVRRMAYAGADGKTFLLPAGGAAGIRIDPGTVAGNVLTVHGIILNAPRSFGSFFIPDAGEAALLVVVPGLLACALLSLRAAGLLARFARRTNKAGDAGG